jgi:hypothetical protein
MKKYCYFMTGSQIWFDAAARLYQEGIAKPVLWLGDDCHFEKAREMFGDDVVVKMLDFVHYPQQINNVDYSGENIGFFLSDNYLRAKDRCLKMMDRVDLYGTFSRLDREVILNKLSIWTLRNLEKSKPDALIMAEAPHSHSQYLIYEICLYLDIPTAKFNTWTPVPLMFLQDMKLGTRQKKNYKISRDVDKKITKELEKYITLISNLADRDGYEVDYIKQQRLDSLIVNKFKSLIKSDLIIFIKDIYFHMRMFYKKEYLHINPYKIGIYGRKKIQRVRKKNLKDACDKNLDKLDLKQEFVYFPLHFEPERTTNPDGGRFHDQVLAILELRKLLPSDVYIYVKEHPSQFYFSDKGSRGRSPLFYNLIKNIKNVKLIDPYEDSFKVLRHAMFVATINGTVAIEAAIIKKKALVFGNNWFSGCPNIISWGSNIKYQDFLNVKTSNANEILDFFIKQKDLYSVPACQNPSAEISYKSFRTQDFLKNECSGVTHLMQEFLKVSNN